MILLVHDLASRVRARRKELRLTQLALASKADVSLRTVLNVEMGKACRLETLSSIAEALGVSVADLLAEPAEAAS